MSYSILDTIGNTPLVEIKTLNPNPRVIILAKSVLRIFDFDDELNDPEVKRLIKERDKARLEKNWNLADKIRDQLKAKGVTVKDCKVGKVNSQ